MLAVFPFFARGEIATFKNFVKLKTNFFFLLHFKCRVVSAIEKTCDFKFEVSRTVSYKITLCVLKTDFFFFFPFFTFEFQEMLFFFF